MTCKWSTRSCANGEQNPHITMQVTPDPERRSASSVGVSRQQVHQKMRSDLQLCKSSTRT